jgi:hypothetical protein
MYGRSHVFASNSNACVASWRTIHVRKSSIGTFRLAAVARMFSSTKRSLPGLASAERSAMSYWPRTRPPR